MAKWQQPAAVWGLEIGGSTIRLVRVERTGDASSGDEAYRIEQYKTLELVNRWMQKIDWPAVLTELGARRVEGPMVVCLPDEQVLYRRLELPSGDDATLTQMAEAQAEGQLPLSRDALALGWDRAGEVTDAGVQPVLLCAARQEHAERIVRALGAAGQDVHLVPSGLALAAGWMHFARQHEEPNVLLDIAAQHTSVVLIDSGQVVHVSTLDEGADHWTEAIADDLACSLEEAETLKQALSQDLPLDDAPRERAAAALARAQDGWEYRLDEVYQACIAALPADRQPRHVVLLGGGANLPGIADRVAQRLGVTPHAPEQVEAASGIDDISWPAVLTAAGAALHGLTTVRPAVRLHQPVVETQTPQRRMPIKMAALVLWLIAAIGTLYGFDLYRANQLESQVEKLRHTASEREQIDYELALGRYLENGAVPPIVVLETFSDVVPKETVLSSWDYSRDATTRIRGKIKGIGQFGTLLRDLAESPHLEHVTMRDASVAEGRGREREWEFEIQAEVAPLFRYVLSKEDVTASTDEQQADETGRNQREEEGGGEAPGNDRRRAARAQEQDT